MIFARLEPATQEHIKKSSYDVFQHMPAIRDFQGEVADFMLRFGHLSDSGNDFSSVPWREKPDMVINLLTQEAIDEIHSTKVCFDDLKLSRLTSSWARLLYDKARKLRLYREQISSLYTLAYGCFRPYYLSLGNRFTDRGVLAEPEDIFFLDAERD